MTFFTLARVSETNHRPDSWETLTIDGVFLPTYFELEGTIQNFRILREF